MARVSYSNVPATAFRRLLGHNGALLASFEVINDTVKSGLSLPEPLREEVRRHLAFAVGCRL
jgi:hypothetical protein